jgi:TolB-like protein
MNLIAELKRRNVIRVAGLYLVGAWLITQVAGTVLPMFGAPEWVARSVVILLAIGFVPALVVAWVFELTTGGFKRDDEVTPAESIAPQTAQRMNRMIIVVLALALGYFAVDKFVLAPGQVPSNAATASGPGADAGAPTAEASIAVLPFVNMSTDAENGFFADGISEELLNVLAGIEGLKVASRTSAFSFRGKDIPIPEIARQLDVRHVLEGSVRKQGQRVRITAQLIHAGTDGHLWSETYDRDLTDIFMVQEEIAQAITRELEGILGQRKVAVTASTGNLDAYQSFLRGRARFHARDELLEAIDDLKSAVAQDPDFAEAWVYLAATWMVAPGYFTESELQAAVAIAETRSALQRAEALISRHPILLGVRARLREHEGDIVGALGLLEEAATLRVQDSNPIMWQGLLLLRSGYVEQAITVLERAVEQDPLAGVNNGYLAIAYLSAGRNAQAEATARKARAQGWRPAMSVIAYDMAARGEHDRAVAVWDELIAADALQEDAERRVAIRDLFRDPANSKVLIDLKVDDRTISVELSIAARRFDLLLDVAEQVQQQDRDDRRTQWWLRSAWLPSTLALREDPRFFAITEDLGMVRMWETRGYPPGCRRVDAPGGDHLDCAGPRP